MPPSPLRVRRAWRSRRASVAADPRVELLASFGRIVGLLTLGIAAIVVVVFAILNATFSLPSGAQAVLRAAHGPDHYTWQSEAIHRVTVLKGRSIREDSARQVAVDLKLNKFQVIVSGVYPQVTDIASDSDVTLRVTAAQHAAGEAWREVTNPCKGQQTLPATLAAMPSGDELADAHPHMVTSSSRILGSQAWEIGFTPTAQIIEQMLLVPLLDRTSSTAGDASWVLSGSERRLLANGAFTAQGLAWVTRSRPYTIVQIQANVQLSDGRTWQLLSQIPQNTSSQHPLAKFSFGARSC